MALGSTEQLNNNTLSTDAAINMKKSRRQMSSDDYKDSDWYEIDAILKTIDPNRASLWIIDQTPFYTLEDWMTLASSDQYYETFLSHGFDDINFLNGLLEEADLFSMNIHEKVVHNELFSSLNDLPRPIANITPGLFNSVASWLSFLNLKNFEEELAKHSIDSITALQQLNEIQLSQVIGVRKLGHRKRILLSLNRLFPQPCKMLCNTFDNEIMTTKCNESAVKSHLEIDQLKKTGSATMLVVQALNEKPPIAKRPRSLANTLKASAGYKWLHPAQTILYGFVVYEVKYLGFKEFRQISGIQNAHECLSQFRTEMHNLENLSDVRLKINFRMLQIVKSENQELVSSQNINTIFCVAQDVELLNNCAWISRDDTHGGHYCYALSTSSNDLCLEILHAFAQAFDIAYQVNHGQQQNEKSLLQLEATK